MDVPEVLNGPHSLRKEAGGGRFEKIVLHVVSARSGSRGQLFVAGHLR